MCAVKVRCTGLVLLSDDTRMALKSPRLGYLTPRSPTQTVYCRRWWHLNATILKCHQQFQIIEDTVKPSCMPKVLISKTWRLKAWTQMIITPKICPLDWGLNLDPCRLPITVYCGCFTTRTLKQAKVALLKLWKYIFTHNCSPSRHLLTGNNTAKTFWKYFHSFSTFQTASLAYISHK